LAVFGNQGTAGNDTDGGLSQQGKQHPQIATDGCGQGGDDRRSDCALPYRVRPRSIILGMRSARFAIGGAAGVRGQRYLQESPAHSIDRTITKTP